MGARNLLLDADIRGAEELEQRVQEVRLHDLHLEGGKAGSFILKHDHFTPARKMRRDVRALTTRNHPEGRFYPRRGRREGAGVRVVEPLILYPSSWGLGLRFGEEGSGSLLAPVSGVRLQGSGFGVWGLGVSVWV